jgi:hypothetical protein
MTQTKSADLARRGIIIIRLAAKGPPKAEARTTGQAPTAEASTTEAQTTEAQGCALAVVSHEPHDWGPPPGGAHDSAVGSGGASRLGCWLRSLAAYRAKRGGPELLHSGPPAPQEFKNKGP